MQCWWGPEDKIKEMIGDKEVIIVPVEKFDENGVIREES